MDALIHVHSGLRWVVLALLLFAIVNAGIKLKRGKYEKSDKMLNLFAMVVFHIQVTIGIVLSFISGKVNYGKNWMKIENANGVAELRFFGLEHIILMVLAMILITIGRKKAERKLDANAKHKTILVWYLIVLLVVLAGIPWPFRGFMTGWA